MEPDMGAFIRETMRGDDRIRDKGSPQFSPPPVVTRTVENIKEGAPTLPTPLGTAGAVFGKGDDFNVELLDCNLSIYDSGGDPQVVVASQSGPRMWYVRGGSISLEDDEADVDTYQIISRISGFGESASGPGFRPASET
jgi:hypothetical protein